MTFPLRLSAIADWRERVGEQRQRIGGRVLHPITAIPLLGKKNDHLILLPFLIALPTDLLRISLDLLKLLKPLSIYYISTTYRQESSQMAFVEL
ncbi:hypothetical protein VN97_g8439 [Penicillium thymicola]|uniref:Uncharacterized protein n=1 Tax=Penicillium thymicola TaxID=293382 RepID=A0AAI9X6E7_PENTH|nr:hypothetical protein VN97_g8439 [Penicillium thymicola]